MLNFRDEMYIVNLPQYLNDNLEDQIHKFSSGSLSLLRKVFRKSPRFIGPPFSRQADTVLRVTFPQQNYRMSIQFI
jgi:hypothetical protein